MSEEKKFRIDVQMIGSNIWGNNTSDVTVSTS